MSPSDRQGRRLIAPEPNSMIEKVRRAIEGAVEYEDQGKYESYISNWPEIARAAIGALREPTKGMLKAGETALVSKRSLAEIWKEMIAAGLRGE